MSSEGPRYSQFVSSDEKSYSAVAIANYSIREGIHTQYVWEFSNDLPNIQELMKIPLGTVHRQKEFSFKDSPCFRIDIDSLNVTMIGTIFLFTSQGSNNYYCLAIFLKTSLIPSSPQFDDLVFGRLQTMGQFVRFALKSNSPLSSLSKRINALIYDFKAISEAGIEKPLCLCMPVNDQKFFALSLTSHLQTMMTTVIEISENNNHIPLFYFLSQFLLPFQAKLSQKEISRLPVPGLYLQVVDQVSSIPFETMMQFSRPWTWIRMEKKEIIQSPDFNQQIATYKDYRTHILLAPEMDPDSIQDRFRRIKANYVIKHPNPAKWATKLVKNYESCQDQFKNLLCEQKLNEIIRRSVALNEMMNHLLNSSSPLLQAEQMNLLGNTLNIKDKEEMKIAVSVALLFDPRAYTRAYGARKEVFSRMVNLFTL